MLIYLIIAIVFMITTPSVINLYPECGEVIYVESDDKIVTFETSTGNTFVFDEGEDLEVGDTIAVVINSMGTPLVYDDKVVSFKYAR